MRARRVNPWSITRAQLKLESVMVTISGFGFDWHDGTNGG